MKMSESDVFVIEDRAPSEATIRRREKRRQKVEKYTKEAKELADKESKYGITAFGKAKRAAFKIAGKDARRARNYVKQQERAGLPVDPELLRNIERGIVKGKNKGLTKRELDRAFFEEDSLRYKAKVFFTSPWLLALIMLFLFIGVPVIASINSNKKEKDETPKP